MKDLKTVDVSKTFPTPTISKEQPNFLGDTFIFVIKYDNNSKKVYDDFFENYNLYLNKLPTNYCTKTCELIFKNNALFLGINIKKQKIALTGRIIVSPNKLHGVVLDIVELDLVDYANMKINTDKLDESIYTTYFQTVRASCFLNKEKLKKDDELIKLVIQYYLRLLLKVISKINSVNAKQKDVLEFLIIYFIYRFFLGYPDPSAQDKMFEDERLTPYKIEFKDKLTILPKFQQFTDLFTALSYFNITNANASALNLSLIQIFNVLIYFSLTSSIDNLIANICVSQYPTSLFRKSFIDSNIQSSIEEMFFSNYITKIDIDSSPLKKLIYP